MLKFRGVGTAASGSTGQLTAAEEPTSGALAAPAPPVGPQDVNLRGLDHVSKGMKKVPSLLFDMEVCRAVRLPWCECCIHSLPVGLALP